MVVPAKEVGVGCAVLVGGLVEGGRAEADVGLRVELERLLVHGVARELVAQLVRDGAVDGGVVAVLRLPFPAKI